MENDDINTAPDGSFTSRQQLFIKYTLAILVDLTVLNLFNEYWDYVYIELFSISLLAAILLQFLLQLTLKIEHRVADYFKARPGLRPKIMRIVSAWAILFISKLLILEAINFAFGESVIFGGPVHGLISFIVVVIAMIVAERLVSRIYNSLA
ncbi:MAG: hypothetical protein IMF09_10610 [Proteobacteria bacterium]|nr:hypothetical protein [Pseudomonadota bacterium]